MSWPLAVQPLENLLTYVVLVVRLVGVLLHRTVSQFPIVVVWVCARQYHFVVWASALLVP